MKKLILPVLSLLFVLASGFMYVSEKKQAGKPKILVYSETNGFRHDNITEGIAGVKKLGEENGFEIDASEDSTVFTPENLKKYKAVFFLNTTGNILSGEQRTAFQQFIRNGGGFIGIHAAADCMYDFPWYNQLVGAWFESHPKIQEAKLLVLDKNHPATKGISSPWMHTDEWYNFKSFHGDKVKVIMRVDESSYEGGKMGEFHPIAWYHKFEGARAFYTELGHTKEDFSDPVFLKHLAGGIRYVLKGK
ncbi:MAG: ThuA domain-containing protein [Mucilaginibacter polytrichastri]|nr:ThuA domain-containing protein [Mucilaginibacter polytrichastri]